MKEMQAFIFYYLRHRERIMILANTYGRCSKVVYIDIGMEQRIHKLLLIIGISIAIEAAVFTLYLLLKNLTGEPSPFILLSFFATYIFMLLFAKRVNIFDKTSFIWK